jgi:hypothetical protein
MEPDPTQSETPAEAPSTTSTITPGVQSRIDELVGRDHEKNRQLEQMNQTMQELIAQNAALAARQSAVAAPVPALPEGVDPSMVDYLSQQMKQAMSQQFAQLEQKFTQAFGSVKQTQEQMAFQAAATGYPPEVQREAEKLMATWKRNGFTGWQPKDAFIYARGQLADQAAQQQYRDRPNGNGGDSVTPGGSLPPSPTRSLAPAKSDDELRRLSVKQREEYWAARVGDSDITY